MSEFGVWDDIGNTRIEGGFAPRLQVGKHKLLLKRMGFKDSSKGLGKFLEAEFVVVESNVHDAGEVRGWAWFINSAGWAGKYEKNRAREFAETAARCIDDKRTPQEVGADLTGKAQKGRGLRVDLEVTPQTSKGGAPKTNDRGEPYTTAMWKVVKQSLEDMREARGILDQMDGETEEPAPAPTPPPAAPPAQGAGLGLLAGLKK